MKHGSPKIDVPRRLCQHVTLDQRKPISHSANSPPVYPALKAFDTRQSAANHHDSARVPGRQQGQTIRQALGTRWSCLPWVPAPCSCQTTLREVHIMERWSGQEESVDGRRADLAKAAAVQDAYSAKLAYPYIPRRQNHLHHELQRAPRRDDGRWLAQRKRIYMRQRLPPATEGQA